MHARAKFAAVILGAALSLAGCALTANITTSLDYSASDGAAVVVGDVRAQNLLLVTAGEGEPAALTGTLYNDGDAPVSITVTVGSTADTYAIEPMDSVQVGPGVGAEAFITTAPFAPGLLASATLTVENSAAGTTPVPIVDGTLPEYQTVLDALDAFES